MKEYPQVRKTGVDAVHESCPQKVYISVMMTENIDHGRWSKRCSLQEGQTLKKLVLAN